MASLDTLDHPEVALHRAFELRGRGLVDGTLIGGERLFEAGKLDDDGALANAGVERLDPAATRQKRAAAGQDVVRRAALTPQNQTTSMGSRADRR